MIVAGVPIDFAVTFTATVGACFLITLGIMK